jgi:hypothetical protein
LTALVAGVANEEKMFSPYSLELMLKQVATLRALHNSIYAEDWPFWIGRSLADSSVTLVPPSQCEGSFEEMTPVANGARVRGWIWDRALKRVPRLIIFADEQDRIIGVALIVSRDFAAGSREIDGQETRWRAMARELYERWRSAQTTATRVSLEPCNRACRCSPMAAAAPKAMPVSTMAVAS